MIDMISVWMIISLNTIQIKYSNVGVSIATCRRGTRRQSAFLAFILGLHSIYLDGDDIVSSEMLISEIKIQIIMENYDDP